MDPVVAAGPRTRMEPRTSEWSLTVLLLVTVMLFSMATSSSPVGGGPEWNRTAGSFSPPSPSSLPLPLRPHAANPESAYRGKRGSLAEDSGAQGIHLLLRPPDLLSPSLSPRLPPHNRPPPAPLSPWEQSNSLEEAWASGDYLETLSFVLPNGEDLALATPLPGHPFDDDDDDDAGGDWALSYEGVLPRRPTPPLDSHVLFSPSTAAPGVPPHTRHARPDVFPAWDDDYDPEDLAPLQPTEILLPDMNSLEYYTNLLAKESVKEGSRPPSGEKHGVRFSQPFVPPTVIHNQSRARPPAVKGEQNSEASPRSAPPPRREPEHPLADPTPWLSLSPSLTSDLEAPTVGPSEPEEKDLFGPSEPPRSSNTTSRVLQPPPLGPPTHLERPYTPAEVTDNPGKSTTHRTAISLTRAPPVTTPRMAQTPPGKQYLCNVSKPELYLVRVGGTRGSVAGFSQVRDLLRREFNRSVELQFLRTPSSFAFRVVSGPLIYTAISVINALRRLSRLSGTVPAVSALYTVPDVRYQVHTLLLFVPAHVDVRVCNFSERVESGLVMAYSETRRRSLESGAVSVQLLNITLNSVRMAGERKLPVDIVFAVRDGRGYLPGYEVSRHLRNLSLVEFSFYVGFPALQIAEPFHYPELNTSHHLRSTWVRTVLLGVPDEIVSERSFKARVERRLASLLEEGLGASGRRRWRRATAAADSSLQVVRVARVSGPKRPLEVLYFVEGPGGTRVPAEETAETLNSLDLQRAAIVLGHQVQRPMAQPVETVSVPPSETQSSSIWLIVGVIVPVLLALFIIILLYWKLCGSEKLEFQPDAINTIQQRQKLQASSVKGFDFAKLHLGQHSKDDIMVIQEAGPPPAPAKEVTPSDGGGLNTPKSKGSSTKTGRTARRRGSFEVRGSNPGSSHPVWSVLHLPVLAWVFSGYFSFLPQSKRPANQTPTRWVATNRAAGNRRRRVPDLQPLRWRPSNRRSRPKMTVFPAARRTVCGGRPAKFSSSPCSRGPARRRGPARPSRRKSALRWHCDTSLRWSSVGTNYGSAPRGEDSASSRPWTISWTPLETGQSRPKWLSVSTARPTTTWTTRTASRGPTPRPRRRPPTSGGEGGTLPGGGGLRRDLAVFQIRTRIVC
ncbi:uncharacterized protein si:dkeyp-27e10.3 isoform X9 [Phycodurus eques]|uniref:uncharacterized protein si:dkeyp-27e10.3 isoform X9 n=1 Tax=Phycodurus eques TaxID=693459 RepID=UPI002ACE23F2|nr:uncharacterized protein si:dkeyp-27e10.3 isoform X9 [Phycodurus eques]